MTTRKKIMSWLFATDVPLLTHRLKRIDFLFGSVRYRINISVFTVSVRSGVFRHNQDSVGTRGLYRHNKTSLLVWTGDNTPIEDQVGIFKRLVTSFDEIESDLILTIRWRWLCSNFICNQLFQQRCEWREICDTTSHMWCPHERCSVNSWLMN